jgi:hypothetical protein
MERIPRSLEPLIVILSQYYVLSIKGYSYNKHTDILEHSIKRLFDNKFNINITFFRYNKTAALSADDKIYNPDNLILFSKLIFQDMVGINLNMILMFLESVVRESVSYIPKIYNIFLQDINKNTTYHRKNLYVHIKQIVFERGYENYYTFGQQLNVAITTNQMQTSLNFKHMQQNVSIADRGWENPIISMQLKKIELVDLLNVPKKPNLLLVFEVLAVKDESIFDEIIQYITQYDKIKVHYNTKYKSIICIDATNDSLENVNNHLQVLLSGKYIQLIFTSNIMALINNREPEYYFYYSIKYYYYLVTGKYFFDNDQFILMVIYILAYLHYYNKGSLNSFNLEKQSHFNPLQANSRRLCSLQRAAHSKRQIENEVTTKINFIEGTNINCSGNINSFIMNICNK